MERITSKLIHLILKFCVPQQNNGLQTHPPPPPPPHTGACKLQIFHNNFSAQTEIFRKFRTHSNMDLPLTLSRSTTFNEIFIINILG